MSAESNGNSQRRPFTAELRLARQGALPVREAIAATAAPAGIEARLATLEAGIAEILARLPATGAAPAAAPAPAPEPAPAPALVAAPDFLAHLEGADQDLKVEIARMIKMIARTKREIASIKHPNASDDDRIDAASNELDAIVKATELATNEILESAEMIGNALEKMVATQDLDPVSLDHATTIQNQLTRIMVSSNFQDITGQRITKVVKTLRFIEDRIRSIIGIFGTDAFTEIELPEDEAASGDAALLNGPQLAQKGLSQADIDAMFN